MAGSRRLWELGQVSKSTRRNRSTSNRWSCRKIVLLACRQNVEFRSITCNITQQQQQVQLIFYCQFFFLLICYLKTSIELYNDSQEFLTFYFDLLKILPFHCMAHHARCEKIWENQLEELSKRSRMMGGKS